DLLRRVGEYLKDGEALRSESFPDPRLQGVGRYWDQYRRYGQYARGRAGDVNHVIDHGYGHLTNQLPRGRTIVTFHDAVPVKGPGVSWRTKASLRHSLRAMRHAAAVVCVSHAARRDLLELAPIPEERIHVIPHGIDTRFRPAEDRAAVRRRLNFTGNVVLI